MDFMTFINNKINNSIDKSIHITWIIADTTSEIVRVGNLDTKEIRWIYIIGIRKKNITEDFWTGKKRNRRKVENKEKQRAERNVWCEWQRWGYRERKNALGRTCNKKPKFSPLRAVLEHDLTGKTPLEGPRLRWEDIVERDVEILGG